MEKVVAYATTSSRWSHPEGARHERHRSTVNRHLERRSRPLAQDHVPVESIVAKDEDSYEISGDLTMHGVTNPITLKAELGGAETDAVGVDRIGLGVTGELSRGDHGMKFNQALGSGNLAVSDKIRLDLDVCAIKQA